MVPKTEYQPPEGKQVATFGGGCFWCTEAVFEELKGVESVVSGYAGGHVEHPSYEQVCGKQTGHAEVIRVVYDPREISYEELLEAFWKTHDPTTLNRQGNDVGPQYRSVIFYHNDEQKELAEHYRQKLNESGAYRDPIVTQIEPFTNFYEAEAYHQDYYAKNPNQGYCRVQITPKIQTVRDQFADRLAEE